MYIEYSPGFTVNSYPLGSFWMARLGLIIGPSF
jgi:hypothetical protein